ncbi:MAG: MCP four helix bundle domain-containing protein, partial [Rhizomicrobium sp.]
MSRKIVIAFSVILAVTIGLGVFATYNLGVVNSKSEDIRANWLPSVKAIGEFQFYWTRFRASEASAGLERNEVQRQANVKLREQYKAQADAAWKHYKPLVTRGEEEKLAAKIEQLQAVYLQKHEIFKELMATDPVKASTFYQLDGRTAFGNFSKAISDDVAFNAAGANRVAEEGSAAYRSARTLIYSALSLAALICVGFGLILVRSISRPLGIITGQMGFLANGKLDIDVPYADQQDEIGQLAGAMSTFKDKLVTAKKEREKAESDRIKFAEEQKLA